jgi:hypothetical protein
MGSIRQGKAFNVDCGASKYSRSRIAPIEPVFSCIDPPEPRFMTAPSTSAVGISDILTICPYPFVALAMF